MRPSVRGWLVGTHLLWDTSASADPLVIEAEGSCYPGESIRGYLEESLEAWKDWRTQEPAAGPFVLPLGRTGSTSRT